ncbi:MAG: cyclopropane fatty acyl phospholipid synthase [Acidobacteriaceae bacterium]
MSSSEKWFQSLISSAGIAINGTQPHDIHVNNPAMFELVRHQGTLGLGDAYTRGWWDCPRLDDFFRRVLSTEIPHRAGLFIPQLYGILKARLTNLQSTARAFEVGRRHYDLDNDLFQAMLGPSMAYSCCYRGDGADTLDDAQFAKYDLICSKLHLLSNSTLLEIGCGWGGFARFAAEHYNVRVIGLTVSEQQANFARKHCAGLPVEILLQDYRSFNTPVDAIASIGMFEHVGLKNYPTFFDTARRCLLPDGLFLLRTTGTPQTTLATDPWINTYIFPNGKIPSLRQLTTALEGRFLVDELQDFGPDSDCTLMAWWKNFNTYLQTSPLAQKIDDHFQRTWQYYLLSCAAAFRARTLQLWQLVLSPNSISNSLSTGYQTVH